MLTHISKEAKKSYLYFLDHRCPFTGLEPCCNLRKTEDGHCKPRGGKEFRALTKQKNQKVLEILEKKLSWVSEVQIKPPEKAIIYPIRLCSSVEKVLWNLWEQ